MASNMLSFMIGNNAKKQKETKNMTQQLAKQIIASLLHYVPSDVKNKIDEIRKEDQVLYDIKFAAKEQTDKIQRLAKNL